MHLSLLTVIIPTYNSGQYLGVLLDSLCKQTYQGFKIIIVDDNSTDNTIEIIEKYKKQLKELSLYVLDKNHGPSYCRNFGLSKVDTSYVTFSDSDDWIDSNVYENSLKYINKNIDVINFGVQYEYYEESSVKKYLYSKNLILLGNEALSIYGHPKTEQFKIAPIVNNKLYKTSYLKNNNITFNEVIRYQEDDIFTFKALLHAQKVAFINNCFYHYVQRQLSLIHQISERSVTHFVLAYSELMDYLKNNNLYDIYKQEFISKFLGSLKRVIERISAYSNSKNQESELLLLLSKKIKIYFNSEELIKFIDISAI